MPAIMIPLRLAAIHTAGLLAAFAAGWFFKPEARPASGAVNQRPAPITPLAGRPAGIAGETWLDAASRDAAAVRGAIRPGRANSVLLEKLGMALRVVNPAERQARWQALLPLMRLEDAGDIRALLQKNLAAGHGFPEETTAFWQRCGVMDPAAALEWAREDGGQGIPDVLGGWARLDSAAAAAWIRDNSGRMNFDPATAITGLVGGLADQSPEAAAQLLQANSEDPLFSRSLSMAADLIIRSRGIAAARQWFNEVAQSGAPAAFKTANLETLLSYGNKWAAGFADSRRRDLAEAVMEYAGEPWFSKYACVDLGNYLGAQDPEAGASVMERFENKDAKDFFMNSFLRGWLERDAASVGEWLNRHPGSPSFDTVAYSLARHCLDNERNLEAARGWAYRISDPKRREWLEARFEEHQEAAAGGAPPVQYYRGGISSLGRKS